ncbi:DUF11 domain-containing protein [Candidatus Saccharibacteria bacterium]|nr:DUF11 domain-containing protein [Candidatus Saccharibacteria bacterium]
MKKIIKLTKHFSIATAIVAMLGVVASAQAWGPERATFKMDEPATYATFNSITDNPVFGDERDFVRVGQINADVTDLADEVEVIPGHQYLVYIYFHNNASSSLNDEAHDYVGVAMDTHMSSSFSKIITPDSKGTITGTITSSNANPTSVWDEAYMTTTYDKVVLHYVEGSAKIYNDWATNNSVMKTDLFTEAGALIGLTSFNGAIPGCEEYSGAVSYVIQADKLAGTIEKTASLDGENYSTDISAKPGDEISFMLTAKNTGDVALSNAIIKDSLPDGLTLVPGSVEYWANDSTTKEQLSDNLLTGGYNFGTFGTGNTLYLTYRATVNEDFDCNSLTNTATLIYDSETSTGDSDTSSTTVRVDSGNCAPLPEEIPNTGPAEIIMAIIVVLGICGGAFYLYRTRRTLKTVENKVSGSTEPTSTKESHSANITKETTKEEHQKESEPHSEGTKDFKN